MDGVYVGVVSVFGCVTADMSSTAVMVMQRGMYSFMESPLTFLCDGGIILVLIVFLHTAVRWRGRQFSFCPDVMLFI